MRPRLQPRAPLTSALARPLEPPPGLASRASLGPHTGGMWRGPWPGDLGQGRASCCAWDVNSALNHRAWDAHAVESPEKDNQLIWLLMAPKLMATSEEQQGGGGQCPLGWGAWGRLGR